LSKTSNSVRIADDAKNMILKSTRISAQCERQRRPVFCLLN
jgi:hypothetical protein